MIGVNGDNMNCGVVRVDSHEMHFVVIQIRNIMSVLDRQRYGPGILK